MIYGVQDVFFEKIVQFVIFITLYKISWKSTFFTVLVMWEKREVDITYVLVKGKCNGCVLLSLTKEVTRYICISCNIKGKKNLILFAEKRESCSIFPQRYARAYLARRYSTASYAEMCCSYYSNAKSRFDISADLDVWSVPACGQY